jgi:uncharacterized protein (DUF2384 family)
VYDYAATILGEERRDVWMDTPNEHMKGAKPIDIINSLPGRVEMVLFKMQSGEL